MVHSPVYTGTRGDGRGPIGMMRQLLWGSEDVLCCRYWYLRGRGLLYGGWAELVTGRDLVGGLLLLLGNVRLYVSVHWLGVAYREAWPIINNY